MSFEKDPRQQPPADPYGNPYGQPAPGQLPYGNPSYGNPSYGNPSYSQPQNLSGYGGGGPVVDSDDRTWATISHVGSFLAAWVALGLLCPLLVLLVKSTRPFVREHAYESLNFQLNALVIAVVGGFVGVVFGFLTLGLGLLLVVPLALAYVIWYCVLVIMASAAANRGEIYRYPAIVRVFSD